MNWNPLNYHFPFENLKRKVEGKPIEVLAFQIKMAKFQLAYFC